MRATITETQVFIECTWEDLTRMAALGQRIYATPTPEGLANQAYLASHPQYREDFVLATLEDFDEEAGYAIVAGWQEMDEEALAEHAPDTVTLTVSRERRERKV